jgi:hypothetical protein
MPSQFLRLPCIAVERHFDLDHPFEIGATAARLRQTLVDLA